MTFFKDKIALITGAGSGIGQALAVSLSNEGCHLARCDRDTNGLAQTIGLINEENLKILNSKVDVTQLEQLLRFAQLIKSEWDSIDILVNCAGATIAAKSFSEISDDEWKWIMDVNVWGTINTLQTFLPVTRRSQGSTVVNMSSMLGLVGMTNQSAYSTTKFAIRGLTESLRMEYADSEIHFMVVHPGAVKTNFIKNSWSTEENKALVESYIDKMGSLSTQKVASTILRAIKKRKGRVVIGKDAKGIDILARLMPTGYMKVILSQIRKKLL